jgi:hypothetical protein
MSKNIDFLMITQVLFDTNNYFCILLFMTINYNASTILMMMLFTFMYYFSTHASPLFSMGITPNLYDHTHGIPLFSIGITPNQYKAPLSKSNLTFYLMVTSNQIKNNDLCQMYDMITSNYKKQVLFDFDHDV